MAKGRRRGIGGEGREEKKVTNNQTKGSLVYSNVVSQLYGAHQSLLTLNTNEVLYQNSV